MTFSSKVLVDLLWPYDPQNYTDYLKGSIVGLISYLVNTPLSNIQKIQQMLEQTYMKTRKITHSMKPPQLEKFGLVPVLEEYCSMIDTDQLAVHLWINGLADNRISYSEKVNSASLKF